MDKAYEGRKSIVDYVFTDRNAAESVERKFVQHLDTAKEVVVYAKLPKGFHIPTPPRPSENGTLRHITVGRAAIATPPEPI